MWSVTLSPPYLPLEVCFLLMNHELLTLNETGEACSSLAVVLGSFVTSWMICWCALGVTLVGWPPLERFIIFPGFPYLWIMVLEVICNHFRSDRCQLLSLWHGGYYCCLE